MSFNNWKTALLVLLLSALQLSVAQPDSFDTERASIGLKTIHYEYGTYIGQVNVAEEPHGYGFIEFKFNESLSFEKQETPWFYIGVFENGNEGAFGTSIDWDLQLTVANHNKKLGKFDPHNPDLANGYAITTVNENPVLIEGYERVTARSSSKNWFRYMIWESWEIRVIAYGENLNHSLLVTTTNTHPEGFGTALVRDKWFYVGFWKKSLKSGFGVMLLDRISFMPCSRKIRKYVGCFQHDVPNGWGHYTFSDGSSFTGLFVDGRRNGFGFIISKSGIPLKGGIWNNNHMELQFYVGSDE